MTKQVKIIFSLGIIFIVLGLITNFTMGLKQDKEEVQDRMKVIDSTYQEFRKEVNDFNTTRNNIYDNVFSLLYFDTLNETIPACLEALTDYEVILDKIEKTTNTLKENCSDLYFPEKDINNKCQTYAATYEEMVNYFVNDITQVNNNIEEFNKYNEENNTGIKPLQKYNTTKDYIDFNKDKKYTGKEDF